MRGPVGIWTRNTQTQQAQMEGETDTEGRIKMWFERGQAEARGGCTGREQREVGEQHNQSTLG